MVPVAGRVARPLMDVLEVGAENTLPHRPARYGCYVVPRRWVNLLLILVASCSLHISLRLIKVHLISHHVSFKLISCAQVQRATCNVRAQQRDMHELNAVNDRNGRGSTTTSGIGIIIQHIECSVGFTNVCRRLDGVNGFLLRHAACNKISPLCQRERTERGCVSSAFARFCVWCVTLQHTTAHTGTAAV